ncbi:MAG TPA: hypothetical protein VGN72_03845 [Tepidisphaeraceae bacterium]|jgi:beta-galactosidase|nr:hypothetical protein [Tepidisphaeraceae bacterium]
MILKVLSTCIAVSLATASLTLAEPAASLVGDQLDWDRAPIEVLSPVRDQIVLNGVWQFQPAVGAAERGAVPTAWGQLRVPGSWKPAGGLPKVESPGGGETWDNLDLLKLAKGWYRREIDIPATWDGRAIELLLDRVSTDADVFVNGQRCGQINWPRGSVRIDNAVKAGERATIEVLVAAASTVKEVEVFMGFGQSHMAKSQLATCGLTGDVLLVSRPAGAHIADVGIRTSTRQQRIDLDVDIADVQADGPVTVTVDMLNGRGEVEKQFTQTVDAKAGANSTITIGWPWADPRLWDVGKPELYTAMVKVNGTGLNDQRPQRFGFREFWIDGRKFMLNGSEIRLRPINALAPDWTGIGDSREVISQVLRSYRDAGFNFVEIWPVDIAARGSRDVCQTWCELADEIGITIGSIALPMNPLFSQWGEPGVKDDYIARMAASMRRVRNSPSHVMWSFTPNSFGHAQDQNPVLMGKSLAQPIWHSDYFDAGWHRRMALGKEGVEIVKSLDPTRPVLVHQGGPVGDVYALNNYLCWVPLQERMEWLTEWSQNGDMPYMAVEFGAPLHTSYMRGRWGGGWGRGEGASHSEPLVSEFAAAYLGPQAYALETQSYRDSIRSKFAPADAKEEKDSSQMYRSFWGDPNINHGPVTNRIQSLFIKETWRSWRALGVTGGLVPWDDAHGFDHSGDAGQRLVEVAPPAPGQRGSWPQAVKARFLNPYQPAGAKVLSSGEALLNNNRDTLAYIAGKPERVTSQDHHFTAGGSFTKQIVLMNDRRDPIEAAWSVVVTLGDDEVLRRTETASLGVAETRMVPIEIKAPMVTAATDGAIVLTAEVGGTRHEDRFAFRVYPTPAPARQRVAVIDPQGKSAAMLKQLGFDVQHVDTPGDATTLIIGSHATKDDPKVVSKLQGWVEQGGALLLMSQHPDFFTDVMGLRVHPLIERRAFPVTTDHPITRGLDADDLRDWVGESRVVDPYPNYLDKTIRVTNYVGFPWHGWRWGGYGGVTSVAIEKPHQSGWTPLIECGFDLMYSPLLTMQHGRGRVTICTLDLEDHAASDPAAALLAQRIVSHSLSHVPAEETAASYIGGETLHDRLTELGVVFERVSGTPQQPGLLLVDPASTIAPDALRQYAERGGRVLVLASADGKSSLATYANDKKFAGSLEVPQWPETVGLSGSDLRTRVDVPAWKIADRAEVAANGLLARETVGTGVMVSSQVNPWALDTQKEPYLRYTRWRHTRALSQLIANMGGQFRTNAQFFAEPSDVPDALELAGSWQAKRTLVLEAAASFEAAHADPGLSPEAQSIVSSTSAATEAGWQELALPGFWDNWGDGWNKTDGEAVFRRTFDVPAAWAGIDLELDLGPIDDFDDTYVNGTLVGRTDIATPRFYEHARLYNVPSELTRPGMNTITIRTFDRYGGVGFGAKPQQFKLSPKREPTRGWYHPDFRTDFAYGDDPYRYCRW